MKFAGMKCAGVALAGLALSAPAMAQGPCCHDATINACIQSTLVTEQRCVLSGGVYKANAVCHNQRCRSVNLPAMPDPTKSGWGLLGLASLGLVGSFGTLRRFVI